MVSQEDDYYTEKKLITHDKLILLKNLQIRWNSERFKNYFIVFQNSQILLNLNALLLKYIILIAIFKCKLATRNR